MDDIEKELARFGKEVTAAIDEPPRPHDWVPRKARQRRVATAIAGLGLSVSVLAGIYSMSLFSGDVRIGSARRPSVTTSSGSHSVELLTPRRYSAPIGRATWGDGSMLCFAGLPAGTERVDLIEVASGAIVETFTENFVGVDGELRSVCRHTGLPDDLSFLEARPSDYLLRVESPVGQTDFRFSDAFRP